MRLQHTQALLPRLYYTDEDQRGEQGYTNYGTLHQWVIGPDLEVEDGTAEAPACSASTRMTVRKGRLQKKDNPRGVPGERD